MSTQYPFVRTECGPPPAALPPVLNIAGSVSALVAVPIAAASGIVAAGGAIIGTIAANVASPTAAATGTVSGGSGVFLPGYLEYFGIFNQDYLTGETRTQFASHFL